MPDLIAKALEVFNTSKGELTVDGIAVERPEGERLVRLKKATIGGAATGLNGDPRAVEGWVNGERRQASSTKHLIFPIEHLVEFITFVMTLEPGDIISTGTPEGIGPITAGDTVKVKIEGVGELINPVAAE